MLLIINGQTTRMGGPSKYPTGWLDKGGICHNFMLTSLTEVKQSDGSEEISLPNIQINILSIMIFIISKILR